MGQNTGVPRSIKAVGTLARQIHTKRNETNIHQLLISLTDLIDPTVLKSEHRKF